MPRSESVRKSARVVERRRIRNKSIRTEVKTNLTKARGLLHNSEGRDVAAKQVAKTISVIDRAVRKGVIHPNNAARRKSHLMKELNRGEISSS